MNNFTSLLATSIIQPRLTKIARGRSCVGTSELNENRNLAPRSQRGDISSYNRFGRISVDLVIKQDNVLTLAFLNLEVIWLILPISLLLPSVGSPSDNTKSNFFSLKVSLSKISILPFQEIHITKYQNVKNIRMFSRKFFRFRCR